jgi:hypothetical protein
VGRVDDAVCVVAAEDVVPRDHDAVPALGFQGRRLPMSNKLHNIVNEGKLREAIGDGSGVGAARWEGDGVGRLSASSQLAARDRGAAAGAEGRGFRSAGRSARPVGLEAAGDPAGYRRARGGRTASARGGPASWGMGRLAVYRRVVLPCSRPAGCRPDRCRWAGPCARRLVGRQGRQGRQGRLGRMGVGARPVASRW